MIKFNKLSSGRALIVLILILISSASCIGQVVANSPNDSTFVYLDGEKRAMDSELAMRLNHTDISHVFVLTPKDSSYVEGNGQMLVVLTEKNLKSKKVEQFLKNIGMANLPSKHHAKKLTFTVGPHRIERIGEKREPESLIANESNNFQHLIIISLNRTSEQEVKNMFNSLEERGAETNNIKYDVQGGVLKSLTFFTSYKGVKEHFDLSKVEQNGKDCLLLVQIDEKALNLDIKCK